MNVLVKRTLREHVRGTRRGFRMILNKRSELKARVIRVYEETGANHSEIGCIYPFKAQRYIYIYIYVVPQR